MHYKEINRRLYDSLHDLRRRRLIKWCMTKIPAAALKKRPDANEQRSKPSVCVCVCKGESVYPSQ